MVVFRGTERSGTNDVTLECFPNSKGELILRISSNDYDFPQVICLNVDTSIALRKQISRSIGEMRTFNKGGK